MGFGDEPFGSGPFGFTPPPPVFPAYQSGMFLLTPRIYPATRDNVLGNPVTQSIMTAEVDWDIDRSGPKSRIKVSASSAEIIEAQKWLAPFIDVIPETGAAVSTQVGLYELGEPTVTYDTHGGNPAEGGGKDIIGLVERSRLTEHQYVNANMGLMGEVRRCFQMASLAYAGPNIFPYTLLRPLTDWGASALADGAVGSNETSTHIDNRPRGDHGWRVIFDPASTYGALQYLATADNQRTPIPAGATQLWLTHWAASSSPLLASGMQLRFFNAGGVAVGPDKGTFNVTHPNLYHWTPFMEVLDVPVGAVSFQLILRARVLGALPAQQDMYLGGFEVGVAIGQPLQRFALPNDTKTTPKVLASQPGDTWLSRINMILAAGGYHAATATLDGRPLAIPLRDAKTTAPSRIYKVGDDIRVASNIVTTKTTSDVHNIVIATQEDAQAGTMMSAIARNDDPAHPWSTRRIGPASIEVVVNNVASEAELQLVADAYLTRVSAQESIVFEVLPDPYLAVHDIIEVTGAIDRINGRWLIDSLDCGLTAESPLVRIQARRVATSAEVAS